MRKKTAIFKSRLAWRFFVMFIACALIPILALAGISYHRVSRQLKNQAFERLSQSVKAHALTIYEGLLLADEHLHTIQMVLPPGARNDFSAVPAGILARSREFFTGLAWMHNAGHSATWGEKLSQELLENVYSNGKRRISTWRSEARWPSLILTRKMDNGDLLVGCIDADMLWGLEKGNILGAGASFCIWDDNGLQIFSSMSNTWQLTDYINNAAGSMPAGKAEFVLDGHTYLSAYWSPFLKPKFGTSHWTVMVLEPKEVVFEPMRSFQSLFPYIVLLALVIVIGLSSRAIRKSLVPIESLMEGARQVSQRRFSHRVQVASQDEFEDLANVFNQMTAQLDHQFKFFKASADMDRAILSVLDIDQIVPDSLKRTAVLFAYQTGAIFLLDSQEPVEGRLYFQDTKSGVEAPRIQPFRLTAQEAAFFDQGRAWIKFAAEPALPDFLSAFSQLSITYVYLFPIYVRGRLYALFAIGANSSNDHDDMALGRIRRFVDRLAVAFANSSLVQELKELNLGTLYALARTVDAKSPWTAGHSSRVTQLALNIAKAMALPQTDMENLRRAGLLHDIGKIGIPVTILDKNGQLTADEYARIKNHPAIGARILTPIRAYKDIIPIVEQHHERYDGKGYPFGLNGEQIHLSARILALADAYDAMVSDRPYRKGLGKQKALEIISRESGKQFDPGVVDAFGRILDPSELPSLSHAGRPPIPGRQSDISPSDHLHSSPVTEPSEPKENQAYG